MRPKAFFRGSQLQRVDRMVEVQETVSASPNGAICPSCGRFVGPLEQCPYCGALVRKRLPLRYLRLGSIALAVLGLVALLYAILGSPTPKVTVASVGATMNYAYVRLEGQVTRGPRYDPETQALSFYLADSTGEIMVSSFRATTRQLLDQKKIPVAGDRVAVEGTLRVRDDFGALNLVSPDKLELTHPAANVVKIGEIGPDDNLQIVSVSGDVREIRTPYKGLTLYSVGDATGEIDLAVYSDILALSGPLADVGIGDAVQVNGTVSFYRESPQLALTNARDLVKLDAGLAPLAVSKCGDLDASRVGTRVSVAGNVTGVTEFPQGRRVILDDGSGSITLLLWQDTLAQVANGGQLKKGARVQALGRLSQYHGDLEVVPNRGSDVQIAAVAVTLHETPSPMRTPAEVARIETPSPTRTPTASAVERTIASISASEQTQNVVVTGRIVKVSSFSKGTRCTLDDGTGTITLLLWSDVFEGVKSADALKVGARVKATGRVNLFGNELEVAPEKGADVILLALSVIPTPAPRTIRSLSADDVGTVVIVVGTANKITDFSQGKYVSIGDGTGEIRVTVFADILNAMPQKDRPALVEGVKLRVAGEVSLYRGELELVPARGGVTIQ
jgi:DNA/RNA endonuclease YhcR with UshA esterase domain